MLLVGFSLLSNKVAALSQYCMLYTLKHIYISSMDINLCNNYAVHCATNIYLLQTLICVTLCFKAPERIRSWSVCMDYNLLLKCFLWIFFLDILVLAMLLMPGIIFFEYSSQIFQSKLYFLCLELFSLNILPRYSYLGYASYAWKCFL